MKFVFIDRQGEKETVEAEDLAAAWELLSKDFATSIEDMKRMGIKPLKNVKTIGFKTFQNSIDEAKRQGDSDFVDELQDDRFKVQEQLKELERQAFELRRKLKSLENAKNECDACGREIADKKEIMHKGKKFCSECYEAERESENKNVLPLGGQMLKRKPSRTTGWEIILAKIQGASPFVTWNFHSETGECQSGNYFVDQGEAERDFERRNADTPEEHAKHERSETPGVEKAEHEDQVKNSTCPKCKHDSDDHSTSGCDYPGCSCTYGAKAALAKENTSTFTKLHNAQADGASRYGSKQHSTSLLRSPASPQVEGDRRYGSLDNALDPKKVLYDVHVTAFEGWLEDHDIDTKYAEMSWDQIPGDIKAKLLPHLAEIAALGR